MCGGGGGGVGGGDMQLVIALSCAVHLDNQGT